MAVFCNRLQTAPIFIIATLHLSGCATGTVIEPNPGENVEPEGTITQPSMAEVIINPGQSVHFEATCTDSSTESTDGGLQHAWNFAGAATDSNAQIPGDVIFSDPGVYVVTYICTDRLGASDQSPAL